jgi:hypothetical protein
MSIGRVVWVQQYWDGAYCNRWSETLQEVCRMRFLLYFDFYIVYASRFHVPNCKINCYAHASSETSIFQYRYIRESMNPLLYVFYVLRSPLNESLRVRWTGDARHRLLSATRPSSTRHNNIIASIHLYPTDPEIIPRWFSHRIG